MMVPQVPIALTHTARDPGGGLAVASDVAGRLAAVRGRMASAAARVGRNADEILLVAVSKLVEPGRVAEALRAGQADFGESRAQELGRKVDALRQAGARWHFVGRLQRNKVMGVVGVAELIHSIDRIELAEAVAARARTLGLVQRVLVQVNTGEDPAKAGCTVAAAPAFVARVQAMEGLHCEGLMTIPPLEGDPRPCFARLASLLGQVRRDDQDLRHLSMGMSNDFEVAVEEGATIVRVGEAVFGARPQARDVGAR